MLSGRIRHHLRLSPPVALLPPFHWTAHAFDGVAVRASASHLGTHPIRRREKLLPGASCEEEQQQRELGMRMRNEQELGMGNERELRMRMMMMYEMALGMMRNELEREFVVVVVAAWVPVLLG